SHCRKRRSSEVPFHHRSLRAILTPTSASPLLSNTSRTVARAARRPALFPQLFPIPDPARHRARQWESELMRKHAHLPAMVGFVREHVAQLSRANGPGRGPAVSAKLVHPAPRTAERFREHLPAAGGALG